VRRCLCSTSQHTRSSRATTQRRTTASCYAVGLRRVRTKSSCKSRAARPKPLAVASLTVTVARSSAISVTDGAVSVTDGAVSVTDGAVSVTDGAVSVTDGHGCSGQGTRTRATGSSGAGTSRVCSCPARTTTGCVCGTPTAPLRSRAALAPHSTRWRPTRATPMRWATWRGTPQLRTWFVRRPARPPLQGSTPPPTALAPHRAAPRTEQCVARAARVCRR